MTDKRKIMNGLKNWIEISNNETYRDLRIKLLVLKEDFEDQLMIMVSGEFNAGKSTFINAILGEELLTVDITPATAMITKLTYGNKKKILAHEVDGTVKEYEWSWLENLTAERKGKGEEIRRKLSYIEFQLPSEFLKNYTLIDSPGLTALHAHHTAVTESFMERNEAGIWLFNAMSVGTASELEWLKTMRDLRIPTYGVVNAIDRLDEEEDLDDFLEYNERRLSPLVSKLYGVSAQEILKGKLENDQELLEWGNADAIQELLNDIGPVEQKKIESFYRKMFFVLKDFQRRLLETKASFGTISDPVMLKVFQEVSYPAFKKEMKIYSNYVKKHEVMHEEWSSLLEKKEVSNEYVDAILNKLGKPLKLVNKWNHTLQPKLAAWKKAEEQLFEEKTQLIRERELFERKWDGMPARLSQKIKLSEEETILAEKIEEFHTDIKALASRKSEIDQETAAFDKLLKNELQKKFLENINKSNPSKQNLESTIESVKERMGPIKPSDTRNLQGQLEFHKQFLSIIMPMLEINDPQVLQSEEYAQAKTLATEIKSIYNTEDYKVFLIQLDKMYFHEVEQLKAPEWNFQLVSKIGLSSHSFSQMPMKLRITAGEASWNKAAYEKRKRTLTKVSIWGPIAMVILFNFLQDLPDDSGYNATYTQETSTENYYGDETGYGFEDTEEESAIEEPAVIEDDPEPAAEVVDTVEETDSYEVSNSEIEAFLQNYRADYMNDLNEGRTARIGEYVDINSSLYDSLSEFIYDNGNLENYYEFEENEIVSIERGDANEYFATIRETFYFYGKDESVSFHMRLKKYRLAASDYPSLTIEAYETIDKSTEILTEAREEEPEILETEAGEEELETVETISLATEEQIAARMRDYYSALEMAFNGGGFVYIEDYLVYGGTDYESTKQYIEKAVNENMTMVNNELSVESIEEYDSSHYKVTLYFEDEYRYQSGAGDVKEVRAEYLLKVTEGENLLIEKMISLDILDEYEF